MWADNHSFASIRKLADEWRILSGTSIDAEFYLDLLAPVSEEEKTAANDFALNLVASGLDEKTTPENLQLLIWAEFGIAKDCGDELLPTDLTEWDAFYDDAKEYDSRVNPKEPTGSKRESDKTSAEDLDASDEIESDETPAETVPTLSSASYVLYAKLLRKVAVYNFTQNYKQGIDLTEIDFLFDAETGARRYEKIRPLVVANYVTDRLLSGDFDIHKLIQGDNLEDLLAVDSEIIGDLKEASFEDPADCTSLDGWLKFTCYYELYAKTHLLPANLNDLLNEIDLVPTSDDYEESFKDALSAYAASVKIWKMP